MTRVRYWEPIPPGQERFAISRLRMSNTRLRNALHREQRSRFNLCIALMNMIADQYPELLAPDDELENAEQKREWRGRLFALTDPELEPGELASCLAEVHRIREELRTPDNMRTLNRGKLAAAIDHVLDRDSA